MWPVPLAAIYVLFEITELHVAIFVGLTKWRGPRIMQSLVMLIATRHPASMQRGLRGLHASACTGRVWSGSGHTSTLATARCYAGMAMGRPVINPMGEAPNKPSKPSKEDSTRTQSIPHPTGAPDP